MRKFLFLLIVGQSSLVQSQSILSVEKIMRDPKWIGVAPSNVYWSEDSKQIFFSWNPDKNQGDSLYTVSLTNRVPQKVSPSIRRSLPSLNGIYNRAKTKKLYDKSGDVFLFDIGSGKSSQITYTNDREFNSTFSSDEKKILFNMGMNLFSWAHQAAPPITSTFHSNSNRARKSNLCPNSVRRLGTRSLAKAATRFSKSAKSAMTSRSSTNT